MEELIQVPCEKTDKREISYQAVCRETREETRLHTVPKYLTKDDRFNCDIYTTDITEEEKLQQMKPEKNGPWVLYKQEEWNMLADQKKLTSSLITFKREIWNATLPKDKIPQYEKKIYKIIIKECSTYSKIVSKRDNHYCSP